MPSLWNRKKKRAGHYRPSVSGSRQPRKKWYHAFANKKTEVSTRCRAPRPVRDNIGHCQRRRSNYAEPDNHYFGKEITTDFENKFPKSSRIQSKANEKTHAKGCSNISSRKSGVHSSSTPKHSTRRRHENAPQLQMRNASSYKTESYPMILFKDTPLAHHDVPDTVPALKSEEQYHDLNILGHVKIVEPPEDDSSSVGAVRNEKSHRKQQNQFHTEPSSEEALMDVLLSMGYHELQCRHAIIALKATENAIQLEDIQDETVDAHQNKDFSVDIDTKPAFTSLHEASKPKLPPHETSGSSDVYEFKDRIKSIMDNIDVVNNKLSINDSITNSTVVNQLKLGGDKNTTVIDKSDPCEVSESDCVMRMVDAEPSTKASLEQSRNYNCFMSEGYWAQAVHDESIEVELEVPIYPNEDSLETLPATRSNEFNIMTELYALLTYFSSCGLDSIDSCTPEFPTRKNRQRRR